MAKRRVALVLSELFLRRLTPALAPLVKGALDFRILDIDRPLPELARLLGEMRPAGVITEWLPAVTEGVLALGYPTIIADTDVVYAGATSIDVDDEAVGREAARHFLQAGHRHFGCVTNGTPYGAQRLAGFAAELLRQGGATPATYEDSDLRGASYMEYWRDSGEELRAWLRRRPKPVAIFAVHDPLGRLLCEACRDAGLKVPEEVAVVGANNDELVCALSTPQLSSVPIPWHRLGEVVGEALLELLASGRARAEVTLVTPGGVVARQSADALAVPDALLVRALRHLRDNFREDLSIGRLCGELRISRRALERRSRLHLGRTPLQVLSELRVAAAKRLLTETTYPVSMVAELSGFGDPERFATVFKRLTGQRPTDLRRTMRVDGGEGRQRAARRRSE